MAARRKREEEAFEINLVPMIDCMLILLIFFMVATSIKHAEKELRPVRSWRGHRCRSDQRPELHDLDASARHGACGNDSFSDAK